MEVVLGSATGQRVRAALFICPRPLECRSRYFPGAPLAPPFKHSPSQTTRRTDDLLAYGVILFGRVTRCPQARQAASLALDFREAQ